MSRRTPRPEDLEQLAVTPALVADGTLPAALRHGVHDLPACVRAHMIYKLRWAIPATWDDAFRPFIKAKALFEEFGRRYPERASV